MKIFELFFKWLKINIQITPNPKGETGWGNSRESTPP